MCETLLHDGRLLVNIAIKINRMSIKGKSSKYNHS